MPAMDHLTHSGQLPKQQEDELEAHRVLPLAICPAAAIGHRSKAAMSL